MNQPFDAKAAAEYGAFIGAAYSMYDSNPNDRTPAPIGIPPGYDLVAWIQMSDFIFGSVPGCFYGIVAQQTGQPSSYVLAIRGTSNTMEWWDDLHMSSTPFAKVANAGNVAEGFYRIYETLEVVERSADRPLADAASSLKAAGGFAQQISMLVQKKTASKLAALGPVAPGTPAPAPSLVVTGHSLGAALATLYVLDNAANQKVHNPLACTFASPRVGNRGFVAAYNALGLTSWRIVNSQDLVPNLPWDILGYRHVDEQELFSSLGKVKSSIACAHALATYMSLIDPDLQPSADCLVTRADNQMLAEATTEAASPMLATRGAGPGGAAQAVPTAGPGADSLPSNALPCAVNITINVGN